MMMSGLLMAVLVLAFSNGANDNFKGVATLFGSRTVGYRQAVWWAGATTFAGSLASVVLAEGLIHAFSGKGLVAASLTGRPSFLLAVGLGAALTVLAATAWGLPVSTTHALIGALVGAGLIMGGRVNAGRLGDTFFLPLAASPFIALALTALIYPALRWTRLRLGVERQMCLCVEDRVVETVQILPDGTGVLQSAGTKLTAAEMSHCRQQYRGRVFGFDAQKILDRFHLLSAGLVGFARGLNDTPKIVALLAVGLGLGLTPEHAMGIVAAAMAVGGLLASRKVAATMSSGITSMNHGQGFTANMVTAFLVTVASRFGVPVSTTHVSCGSLIGLGALTGSARWKMIGGIALAWVATLPLAALMAAGVAVVIS
ncbi:MAG: anion permease [Acidobacteriota bacterium]